MVILGKRRRRFRKEEEEEGENYEGGTNMDIRTSKDRGHNTGAAEGGVDIEVSPLHRNPIEEMRREGEGSTKNGRTRKCALGAQLDKRMRSDVTRSTRRYSNLVTM